MVFLIVRGGRDVELSVSSRVTRASIGMHPRSRCGKRVRPQDSSVRALCVGTYTIIPSWLEMCKIGPGSLSIYLIVSLSTQWSLVPRRTKLKPSAAFVP